MSRFHNNHRGRFNNNSRRRDHQRPRHQQNRSRTGMSESRRVDEAERTFLSQTAIDPAPRMRLEAGSQELTMRAMDLICPIGMGQRGLIVAPPGSGKTTYLKHLCHAIAASQPDVKLYCLLVDERPEEVTDFRRSVPAEVKWSSSDETYEHHIQVAQDMMSQIYKEVAVGANVVLVIDSLTRLGRVHNAERRSSGRTLSGGVDARALETPRRIFGSARNIENGGSLTILATILIETGSRMDEVIFEEFKGTGNMEIVLSREIANQRIYPAIDIAKSGTRKIELLLEAEELDKVSKIRKVLATFGCVEAAKALIEQLQKYKSNEELLAVLP